MAERRYIIGTAVEVSTVVDRYDVERAQRRAAALRQAGYLAVAAVAGEQYTEGAEKAAQANTGTMSNRNSDIGRLLNESCNG